MILVSTHENELLVFLINNMNLIITSIVTLLSAFFGVFFAYKLEDKHRRREKNDKQLSEANYVLFALYERIHFLREFQRKSIEPVRHSPAIAFEMQPTLNLSPPDSKFNIEQVLFLLDTKHKQLVLDLHLEKVRFNSAYEVIKYRSSLHLNEVQPALEQESIRHGGNYTGRQMIEAMGERLYALLEGATNSILIDVDETLVSHLEVKDKLVIALQEFNPDKQIMNFSIKNL